MYLRFLNDDLSSALPKNKSKLMLSPLTSTSSLPTSLKSKGRGLISKQRYTCLNMPQKVLLMFCCMCITLTGKYDNHLIIIF